MLRHPRAVHLTLSGSPMVRPMVLKQICTDILIDEAYHIDFQTERMAILFDTKSDISKFVSKYIYAIFFFGTSLVVWFAHKKLFKAGGTGFKKYMQKMKYKYFKTLYRISFSKIKLNMLPIGVS